MSQVLNQEEFLTSFLQLVQNRASEKELTSSWLGWLKSKPEDTTLFELVRFRSALRQNQAEHLLGLLDFAEAEFEPFFLEKVPPAKFSDPKLQPARESVLSHQFPELSLSGDADISSYFVLRQKKEMDAARKIYARLSEKYPDPEMRSNLLRWHRTGRGLFSPFYWQLRNQLADRLLDQVRKTILYILRCFTDSPGTKAWDLLTRIRTVVKILPSDRNKAWDVLERLQSYAVKLSFHQDELSSVCKLMGDYYSDVLFSRKEIKLVLPKSLEEGMSAHKPKAVVQTFDVGHIEFSPQDLKEIVVNPKITGLENISLTYCFMYWLKTQDSSFENKVYLYSLQNRSAHYKIFQMVKKGQETGVKDEDILYAIYNVISRDTAYEYNVRKDIYMQNTWRKIKPGQEEKIVSDDSRSLAEERIQKAKEEKKRLKNKANQAIQQEREEKQKKRSLVQDALSKNRVKEAEDRARTEQKLALMREADKMEKMKAAERAKREREAMKRPVKTSQGLQNQWTNYDGTEQAVVPLKERVQALGTAQGKNVHHLFRSRLEIEIQDFVQNFIQKEKLEVKAVQKTLAVLAIKDFLNNHYDKPYRSWVLSNERMKVKELGLNISDVEPIIENCLNSFALKEVAG